MVKTNPFNFVIAILFASFLHVSAQTYTVTNRCPSAIELFIGQTSEGNLATNQSIVKTGLGTSAGFFYTKANGGDDDDGDLEAARAGFYFEPDYWYYYIVRDDGDLNTGISITPDQPADNGPPVFHGPVPPPPDAPAPSPPLYQCRVPGTNFEITFCPSGVWPTDDDNDDNDDDRD
ncbi:hypothetical protein EST38_g10744 [Candolleomyces aberdarensis]|uniref:Uncharacterized protein n=1 Tax=Candolleomyces aberdarensis TaxID=2316362 RepID=A0A4Q2D6M7_9AGAR|nr:hypothetical protein EST38_g10744 [Candolleomyces aberdarensis]